MRNLNNRLPFVNFQNSSDKSDREQSNTISIKHRFQPSNTIRAHQSDRARMFTARPERFASDLDLDNQITDRTRTVSLLRVNNSMYIYSVMQNKQNVGQFDAFETRLSRFQNQHVFELVSSSAICGVINAPTSHICRGFRYGFLKFCHNGESNGMTLNLLCVNAAWLFCRLRHENADSETVYKISVCFDKFERQSCDDFKI